MRLNRMIASAAALSLIASPVVAADNPAAKLSLRNAAVETEGGSSASGTPGPGLMIAGLAVVLVIVAALALGSGGGGSDSTPASA